MKAKFLLVVLITFGYTNLYAQKPDVINKKVPFFTSRSPEKLALYLTKYDTSDYQKALNIYTWITNNIRYDLKAFRKVNPKHYTVKRTLRRRKGLCQQYSELFEYLCKQADIPCQLITGYSKGFDYYKEDTFYESDHTWNAVLIDSSWYLVDVTWGSGVIRPRKHWFQKFKLQLFGKLYIKNKYKFIQKSDLSYFMAVPEDFILRHLPINPECQLLTYPMSVQTYESAKKVKYLLRRDPLYQVIMDSSYLSEKLFDYQKLRYDQYYRQTSSKSYLFNKRNYSILGRHSYLEGLSLQHLVSKKSKQDALRYYSTAITNYKRHIRSANTECNRTINKLKKNISKDLRRPLERRLLINNGLISKKRKSINKQNYELNKQELGLENLYISKQKLMESYNPVSSISKINWDSIYRNKVDSLNRFKDSVKVYFTNVGLLETKVNTLNNRLLSLQGEQSAMCQYFSNSLVEALPYEMNNEYAMKIDSLGDLIDTLILEAYSIRKHISQTKAGIFRFESKLSNLVINWRRSGSLRSIEQAFLNKQIIDICERKIQLAQAGVRLKRKSNHFNISIYQNSLNIRKHLYSGLFLVNLYEGKRVKKVKYRKSKSTFLSQQIINNCTANIKAIKNR